MSNQNKILFKQTLLLVLASILTYILGATGSYVETYGGPEQLWFYLIFYSYLFFILLVFTPISVIYFLRINKNASLVNLNIIFNFFCWILISTLLALFVFNTLLEIYLNFYTSWPGLNVFMSVWYSMKHSGLSELMDFLYYAPELILAGLLYWAVRINKSFSIEGGQKLIK